ncbi:hypothetical protein MtrunA17_Chr3g0122361 [Medicago truncatula]|uniref:Uncharacterized protein n=1 Tax=Medicago truncatula TaxID=3880 RepID=A0A396IUJ4_MEDTR|nr:uncharacterized protein LOC11438519 isoform X1 [Medicago truncatula]RHN69222.1 hypothetical protein MtrunA17_Chr3g0122361 [Medicago truncatula]
MEQDRRLELIDQAIQKHIHDNNHNLKDHETEYKQTLSHLFSVSQQLEMSKGGETVKQSEASSPLKQVDSAIEKTKGETADGDKDEIIKELKKVKKQNFVTHCLLSAMIVLTVAWQLSEVSLVMRVKDGMNHPFRSVGNMFKEMVKDVSGSNGQDAAGDKENNESTSLPSLKIPDMTNVDVPNFGK